MMGRNSRFISKTGFEEIASNTISGESVLVGCIGSDMGNVAYSNITCATNQQINAITQFKNGIEPLYVYYLLSTMKSYFQKIAGSTTTPILPKSVFEEIEIHLPDMKKQKDVVSILYALDRKIELNKQINDNLRASRAQSQTQFELCRGAAVNADVSLNLQLLDRSSRGARVRRAA